MLNMFLSASEPVVTEPGTMDKILEAAKSVIDFSGECLLSIVNNPVYLFCFAVSFVGIGLALVRKLRKTAKG